LRTSFVDYIVSEMGILQLVKGTPRSEEEYEQAIDEATLLETLGVNYSREDRTATCTA